jgi:hypothetical protein
MPEIEYEYADVIRNIMKSAYAEKSSDAKADLFFELVYAIAIMIKSEEKHTARKEFFEEIDRMLNHFLNSLDSEFPNENI